MSVIHQFRSTGRKGLFAFARQEDGSELPARHGPWQATGRLNAADPMPHNLDRRTAETSIDENGYQMWRMKPPA